MQKTTSLEFQPENLQLEEQRLIASQIQLNEHAVSAIPLHESPPWPSTRGSVCVTASYKAASLGLDP